MRTSALLCLGLSLLVVVVGTAGAAENVCDPGSQFLDADQCNTCQCNEDGSKFWCTKKLCLKLEEQGVAPTTCPAAEEGQVMTVDCNVCTCMKGAWTCTRMACNRRKREETCNAGEQKQEDCNTCFCTNGFWSCTRMSCPPYKREVGRYCEPSKTFKMACNTCRCNAQGTHAACTLKFCPPEQRIRRQIGSSTGGAKQTCTPNSVFKRECNTCKCSSDGTMEFCTRRMCPPMPQPTRQKRETEEKPTLAAEVTAVAEAVEPPCTPNDVKIEGCNRCKCAKNGIGWFCTPSNCPPTTNNNNNGNSHHH